MTGRSGAQLPLGYLHNESEAGTMHCLVADRTTADFEPILGYFDWYDCPRFGLCQVGGVPHYFRCEFSTSLDDYPDEFQLWAIDGATVEREVAQYQRFARWRGAFDRGEAPPPFEQDTVEGQLLNEAPRNPHGKDRWSAVPEFRFDDDHWYAVRTPQHFVRWHQQSA